jgi:hypothetical protein
LNVRYSQIEECIEKALFAVDGLPRNPELEPGELLLLQLVKSDAERLGKLRSRIEFALIFDHTVEDPGGKLSRLHWPNAGKTWKNILVCRDTIPSIPFSLENLDLSVDYAGQTQCVFIEPRDEQLIRRYFIDDFQRVTENTKLHPRALLETIRNYDRVVLAGSKQVVVSKHIRRQDDPWLSDALKTLYGHRCQVCTNDFKPRYGVAHAETRFITDISKGGSLDSRNRVVVCPNHNAIIHTARGHFNAAVLTFEYANGLVEPLLLRDHFVA